VGTLNHAFGEGYFEMEFSEVGFTMEIYNYNREPKFNMG